MVQIVSFYRLPRGTFKPQAERGGFVSCVRGEKATVIAAIVLRPLSVCGFWMRLSTNAEPLYLSRFGFTTYLKTYVVRTTKW